MTRPATLTIAVLIAVCGAAAAEAPRLMERAVLPATPALPTCACAVPLSEGDQLVVGLANGEIVSFHETAGRVIPRTAVLPGDGPIDAIVACRVGRAAGSANEFALLAVRGRRLFSIGFGDMAVAGSAPLPAPSGRYEFARATRRADPGQSAYAAFSDHPVLFDGDSALSISVETRTLQPRIEPVIDSAAGLTVTALSDRVVAVAGPRIVEFAAEGGTATQIDERTDLADESIRVIIAGQPRGEPTLELQVLNPDSVWVSRKVAAPGRILTVTSVSDTLLAMGGAAALTPSHDIGWVALVGPRGRIVAESDHATPVTSVARVSNFIAVQGAGRNLSVYDLSLNPLYDHDSPVTDVVLLAGDFAGGAAEDLAVVGTRTFGVSTADVDAIRGCLNMPDFMASASRTDWGYELRRSFITFYVSNEEKLRRTLAEGSAAAEDAFERGEIEEAVTLATDARAAAAVLGDHGRLKGLSARLREFVLLAARRRSLFLSALLMAALGIWVAVECGRRTVGILTSAVAAVLLLASGAWAWKLVGNTGLNPFIFTGGAIAAIAVVRTRVVTRPRARISGAAIEDLIRALMEFLHGAGEGVPSDGVVDVARKSVTKVAYLAQEMVDSMDDRERYELIRERFESRAHDFLDTTHPRVLVLLSHAERAGFVVPETAQMARAADRMRSAIASILSDTPPRPPVLRQLLQDIKAGRDQLAASADRAWAIVQTNPGCSLTRSIERILREKHDQLTEGGMRVRTTDGVAPERDAVALWSFELRFILENLVTNAVRAMRDSKERALTIETSTDGATCSIRVADTGVGMDGATARGLFDATGDERGGGFGMPHSRLRLQEQGGDLVLERTAPGEGTTFLMTIPHWTPLTGESDA